MAGASAYGMSKFAVRAWAESMRAELHADGITVTLISPGFVSSEIRKVDNQGVLHAAAADPIPDWLRMPADVAARRMVRGILRGKRELIITGHGKLAVFFAPSLIRAAHRAASRGRIRRG
jgi:short-subunit dehydrogenase